MTFWFGQAVSLIDLQQRRALDLDDEHLQCSVLVIAFEKVSPALSSLLHNPVEAPLRQKPYIVGMISESKLAVVRASLSRFVTWQHSDFIGVDNARLHALRL
jgi:hypothetical protein